MLFDHTLVMIRGAGDIASGVALRLQRAGFPIVMTELTEPLVVRRSVAFAEAVREGSVSVEEVVGRLVDNPVRARVLAHRGEIAVLVDPEAESRRKLRPRVMVDARLAKRNLGTSRDDAPLVIGLGPGFTAGEDVDAVVETMRGHDLGRVLWEGAARADTGTPGLIAGIGHERVLRAPVGGRFSPNAWIGDVVEAGAEVAHVEPERGAPVPVVAPFRGLLRGLLADGVVVEPRLKVGDLDPRLDVEWHLVSDKALAVGGGVIEAVLTWLARKSGKEDPA